MSIGQTILDQLGGAGKLSAMIGARLFVALDDGLQFKFAARAKNKSNCIVIKVDPSDTYTVEFWTVRGANTVKREEETGIYADMLRDRIEDRTGLRLSLGTLGGA